MPGAAHPLGSNLRNPIPREKLGSKNPGVRWCNQISGANYTGPHGHGLGNA
tara:strand:+ start:151 stop:303 length:153 start_codon:yes stop_codon:yes gene_type:complete